MRLLGQFITATVTRVSFDKEPLYDVRTNDGAFFRGIPTKAAGRSFYPLAVYDSVLLLFPNGAHDLPYIIGADVAHIKESTPSREINADYEPDALDIQIRQDSEVLSLGASGTTIDTAVGVRVQLPELGVLRVSRAGQSDNNVLEAQPFIDSLYAYLSALEATVNAMQAQVAALSSAQGTAGTVIALQAQVAALSAAAGLSGTPTAVAAAVPPLAIPAPVSPPSSAAAKVDAETTISGALKIP